MVVRIIKILDSKFVSVKSDDSVVITDANGTIVSTDLSDITNISKEKVSSVSDFTHTVSMDFERTITVNNSNASLKGEEATKLVKDGGVSSIDITIEATHDGILINNALYEADSMSRDFASFFSPYSKPLLKNHNMFSGEPIGRIKSASFKDSQIVEESGAIEVNCHITDKDAIEKFVDGRYNTVSIGGSPRTIKCNHCGKHILKDSKFKFCGHWRGNTYENRKATWTLTDISYDELSVVNHPADPFAQVTNIKINKNEEAKMPKTQNSKEAMEAIQNALQESEATETNASEPNAEPVNNNEEPKVNATNEGENLESKVAELNNSLEEANSTIKELNEAKLATDLIIENHVSAIEGLNKKIAVLNSNAKILANYNLDLMKDKLELLDSTIERDSLSTLNVSELNAKIENAKEVNERQRATVSPNTLAVGDTTPKTNNEKEAKSENNFNDLSDSLLNSWR